MAVIALAAALLARFDSTAGTSKLDARRCFGPMSVGSISRTIA